MTQQTLEFKPSKKIQKERVLDFLKSRGGIITNWDIDKWSVNEKGISCGSASRHCRTLANEGIIAHPKFDGVEDRHSWILVKKI